MSACGSSAGSGWRMSMCRPAATFRTGRDRKSTRLNSSHANISYAVFCLKKKKKKTTTRLYTKHYKTPHNNLVLYSTPTVYSHTLAYHYLPIVYIIFSAYTL